jgi:hypothetical protein
LPDQSRLRTSGPVLWQRAVAVIQAQEYFAIYQAVIKRFQFVHLALNEIQQFSVGIEMDGLKVQLHTRLD